jgi:hypothetical protein
MSTGTEVSITNEETSVEFSTDIISMYSDLEILTKYPTTTKLMHKATVLFKG